MNDYLIVIIFAGIACWIVSLVLWIRALKDKDKFLAYICSYICLNLIGTLITYLLIDRKNENEIN